MESEGKESMTRGDVSRFLSLQGEYAAEEIPDVVSILFAAGDINHDNLLERKEVVSLVDRMASPHADLTHEEVTQALFAFNTVGDEKPPTSMTRTELQAVLEKLTHETLQPEDLDALIAEADRDKDGRISMEEFATFLSNATDNTFGPEGSAQRNATSLGASIDVAIRAGEAVRTMEQTFLMLKTLDRFKALGGKKTQGLGVRQRQLLRDIFDRFDASVGGDTAKDGTLSVKEVSNFLHAVGAADSEEEAQAIVDLLDTHTDGKVSFEEVLAYAEKIESQAVAGGEFTEEDIAKELFVMIDRDGSGHVSVAEMQREMSNLGMEMSMEDVYGVVQSVDSDDDVQLNQEEFAALLKQLQRETE